jgi:hypothetical protein
LLPDSAFEVCTWYHVCLLSYSFGVCSVLLNIKLDMFLHYPECLPLDQSMCQLVKPPQFVSPLPEQWSGQHAEQPAPSPVKFQRIFYNHSPEGYLSLTHPLPLQNSVPSTFLLLSSLVHCHRPCRVSHLHLTQLPSRYFALPFPSPAFDQIFITGSVIPDLHNHRASFLPLPGPSSFSNIFSRSHFFYLIHNYLSFQYLTYSNSDNSF